jgi:hypothetical protein
MRSSRIPFVVSSLMLVLAAGCNSNNNDPEKDLAVADQPSVDRPIPDDPFGRVCDLGKPCARDNNGGELTCIGIANSPKGKGFCTRQCTDVGNECYGALNGQTAACILTSGGGGDAGPGMKFCAFLCKSKSQTWTCPATMKCGPADGDTALCVPLDIKPPDLGVKLDKGPVVDQSGIPSNSGKICEDASGCNPSDDCLLLTLQGAPTPTKKMCVMSCKSGTSCPVPEGSYSSMCFLTWGTKMYCVWFCEYQGKSYQCPDAESFQCVLPDKTQPGTKICIPN